MHDAELDDWAPPNYGWRPNPFGRHVSPSERKLIAELAAIHGLDVEPRHKAYLFRKPSWQGQVLRLSWGIVCWPRGEVLRGFAKAVGIMPLPADYAGLYLKKLRGPELDAYLFRVEHCANLLK